MEDWDGSDDSLVTSNKVKIKPFKFSSSIYKEEEVDNFILSIRDSIINNVMLEIDRIDLTTRTIAFIVDIGCDALWRMLNIEFIQHSDFSHCHTPNWSGDGYVEPSPIDNWKAKSIPIVSSKTSEPVKELPKFLPKVCECHQLGIPCECQLPINKRDLKQMKLLSEPVEILIPSQMSEAEEERFSLGEEEELEMSQDSNPKVSSVVDDVSRSIASLKSDHSIDSARRLKCVLSEGFSKLQEKKKQVSLPILNVTHPTRTVSLTNMITELPALRVHIKTECVTVKEVEKPTKKKLATLR